jgi:hypothetical protein
MTFGDKPAGAATSKLNPVRADEMMKMQTQFLTAWQDMHREWLERAKVEADFASEFVAKLSAARSLPDAATLWQDWTKRRMEMLAEDTRRLLADSQKFFQAGARFGSTGWPTGGGST